jgi:hypothetical protein
MTNILEIAKPLIDRGTNLATAALGTAAGQADGLVKRFRGGGEQPQRPRDLNDPTLKSKVESALYRLPGVTRSKVKVTVADGVVTLHGEVGNQAQMATVETAVNAVPEVRGYESQLHLPKTPAPSTPAAGTRQARTKKPAAATKAAAKGRTQKVNRDKTTDAATAAGAKPEKKPVEMAAKGQPRQPAPLGSKDTES